MLKYVFFIDDYICSKTTKTHMQTVHTEFRIMVYFRKKLKGKNGSQFNYRIFGVFFLRNIKRM